MRINPYTGLVIVVAVACFVAGVLVGGRLTANRAPVYVAQACGSGGWVTQSGDVVCMVVTYE